MRKLLLRVDIPSLGFIGDVVNVKDGYARNYLIPSGLAMAPTETNVKAIEDDRKKAAAVRVKKIDEKKAFAKRLEGVEVTIVCKSNEQGHLFGSVGPKEIAAALLEEGYNVDEQVIKVDDHFKIVDKYTVPVRFTQDIECSVTVWVTPEKSEESDEEGTEETETDVEEHDDEYRE